MQRFGKSNEVCQHGNLSQWQSPRSQDDVQGRGLLTRTSKDNMQRFGKGICGERGCSTSDTESSVVASGRHLLTNQKVLFEMQSVSNLFRRNVLGTKPCATANHLRFLHKPLAGFFAGALLLARIVAASEQVWRLQARARNSSHLHRS